MGICFVHIQQAIRCQVHDLTSFSFYGYALQLSQIVIFGSLFLLISCQKFEGPKMAHAGPFKLYAIDRSICQGMQVQLHLFDETLGKNVDFSQFTFEPIPSGLGEVSISGLYKAPDFISENIILEIKVKWDQNPTESASYAMTLTANSDMNLISKIPHQVQFTNYQFYSLSASNEFLLGSPIPDRVVSSSFSVSVVGLDGQTKWSHSLGLVGWTYFGMSHRDHSLVSGWMIGGDGLGVDISKIYDPNGKDLQKPIQEQIVFRDYYLNQSNELFVSNSAYPRYQNPTQVFKLSSDFEILQMISINYPLHSFMVDDRGSFIGYYVDQLNEKSGVVKVDSKGVEVWNLSLPYSYPYDAKLVQIDEQRYGMIKEDCNVIPCVTELIYYEFGVNGEIINPGQTIVSSISLNRLIDTQKDDLKEFYILANLHIGLIKDILLMGEEVLFVFYAITKNYKALMIKGTQGSSLEYWWDPKLEGQTPLTHIHLRNIEGRLEWKTFCGYAICTFELDKNLTFDPCF